MSLLPGYVPNTLQGMPGGIDGTRATLSHMVRIAREYKKNGGIVTLARQIIEKVGGPPNNKNYSGFVRALFEFVRDKIRYVPDILGVEMLQTPTRTLEIKTGDCDDKAILLAALLSSIGLATRFVAVGFKGGGYAHVIVEVKLGRHPDGSPRWVPLDTIADGRGPGWLPPHITRRMEAHV